MPKNAYEKLELFTDTITNDALEESRRIYDAIKEESEQILTAAEDEALNETFRYVKREVARIRSEAGQVISKKVMENKVALARRRSEMSRETLCLVRKRLQEYVTTEHYRQQLRSMVRQAAETLGGDTVVYLRAEDMPLAETLAPEGTDYTVVFMPGGFELGGLQAVCEAKHMQIDESFDASLDELSGRFAELFGLVMAE